MSGIETTSQAGAAPIQLAFPLPKAPESNIHLHLTIHATSIVLFLTTRLNSEGSELASLGSFVYAIPDRFNSSQALSTPLYVHEPSLELTQRLAKLLARKTKLPVYVGNSMSFDNAGMGGTIEEQMEGFKKVVDVVMHEISRHQGKADVTVNGC